jgi:hypothetical protein
MADRCPHKGVALSKGRVSGDSIVCAYHGFRYGSDGKLLAAPPCGGCEALPSGMQAKTYQVSERYGFIWLWWGQEDRAVADIAWFAEISPREAERGQILSVNYPISFDRLMESNCDAYHVAYLHNKSVPGFAAVVQEASCSVDGSLIAMRTSLDDCFGGNRTVVHKKLLVPAGVFSSNEDGSLRNAILCCPINEQNSWFMISFWTPCFKLPVIGRILNLLFLSYIKRIVLPEDFRIQQTQTPPHSGFGTDRLVVAADRMVLEYWRLKRRALAKEEAPRDNNGGHRSGAYGSAMTNHVTPDSGSEEVLTPPYLLDPELESGQPIGRYQSRDTVFPGLKGSTCAED